MPINLYPQSGDIVRLDPSYIGLLAYPVEVTEELNTRSATMVWSTTIETTRVFGNSAGGELPTTIERVGNFIPLNTGSFDGILSENDNNLQVALETIDDHDHTHTHVHQHTAVILLATHALGGTVAAGATSYMCPYIDGLLTPTERAMAVSRAGTLKNFYFRLTGTQPATGSLVAKVRKNNADTAIVITMAANAPAGTYSDTSHTVAIAAGDYVSFSIVNNAAGNSGALGFCTVEVEYSTG
jgi:hypothetical protein